MRLCGFGARKVRTPGTLETEFNCCSVSPNGMPLYSWRSPRVSVRLRRILVSLLKYE